MTMKPPSGGPSTGPISAGMVSQAIAATICCLETERRSNSRPTGSIIAPPMPCTIRASTRNASEGAKPHSTEPSVNTTMAARNTWRLP